MFGTVWFRRERPGRLAPPAWFRVRRARLTGRRADTVSDADHFCRRCTVNYARDRLGSYELRKRHSRGSTSDNQNA